jgi:prepilin-type processing-associated H-X9-DG protein
MQCTNNLKQLSLSLHNYHDVRGAFPSNATRLVRVPNTGDWPNYSCVVPLLPYIEQQALYDFSTTSAFAGYDPSNTQAGSSGATPTVNQSPWYQSELPFFACPSDPYTTRPGYAQRTYVPCSGDWPDKPNENKNTRGLFPQYAKWLKFSSVTDGTSNTIAFSERITSSGKNSVKGAAALGTDNGIDDAATAAGAGALNTVPLTCQSRISTTDRKIYTGTTENNHMGTRWADGRNYQVFATILPPNSASCQAGASVSYGNRSLMSASSNHSGGVNVGLLDGSVRFVSDTVNTGEAMAGTKPTDSGKSPFGVWGTYGTINAGESVTL